MDKSDLSSLRKIDLRQSAPIHPEWIHREHPELTQPMHHPLHAVEEFTHRGHHVRISTTYKIEINGQEVHPHASITQGGAVSCHSTPYTPYESVAALVRSLINNTPEECIPGSGGDQH